MANEPGAYAPPAAPNSTMAIISLVAGILGWTLLPGISSIAAIITGHLAKKEIRESGGSLSGDGLATFGLILGYSAVGIGVVVGCCFLSFFFILPLLGIASGEFSSLPTLFGAF